MTEYVVRFLNMLVAALLAPAHRLTRLAAVRHEVEQYTKAYEEAQALEASGKPELARLLRAELEQTIGSALTAAGPAPQQPALNDGNGRPFALEPPRPPADPGPSTDQPASQPEGQGTPPRRCRGRPSKKKAARQQAAQLSNPTPPPVTSPDHP